MADIAVALPVFTYGTTMSETTKTVTILTEYKLPGNG
jgi:hypothetical protein